MRPALLNLSFIVILFLSLHSVQAEESQEERGKARGVNTLYSSDVADMNFNIDSPPLRGEIFPETRKRILTATDIKSWPDAKLQYAINEMYARRNANFGNKKVKKFFLSFDWYTPISEATLDAVEMHFSAIETSNLKLLGEARQTFKSSGAVAVVDDKTRQPVAAAPTFQPSNPPEDRSLVKATPKPARSGKTFDEMMKENDDWANQGMKHDASTGGLNLETSLAGGPTSLELEKLLQMIVEHNSSWCPEPFFGPASQRAGFYESNFMHNKVTSATVTNEYTWNINDENVCLYEFTVKTETCVNDLETKKDSPMLKNSREGYTIKVTKRGKKWYVENGSN